MQFQKHLPIQKGAELLAKIAQGTDNPFAQLKAIERADDLDGIVTDIERLKTRRADEPRQRVPMFTLPEGARISVTVNQVIPTPSREENQPAMRNVTPPAIETNAAEEVSTNQ